MAIAHNAGWETVLNEIRILSKFRSSGVQVTNTGDNHNGRIWNIIFDGHRTLNVQIVENTISGGNPSNPVSISLTHLSQNEAKLFHNQVPSQLLRTLNDKPQLNIKVNGDYVVCPEQNCQLESIPLSDVPTIESYTLVQGNLTIVLVDGANLNASDFNTDTIRVTFGGISCSPTVSLPNITCTFSTNANTEADVEAGDWVPRVELINKGFLQKGSISNTTIQMSDFSFTPTVGDESGGTKITITGTGFGVGLQVKMGTELCQILSISFTQIVILSPPSSAGTKQISILQNGLTKVKADVEFTYQANYGPVITGISPESANPVLRTKLTISGTNLLADDSKVTLTKTDDSNIEQSCYILSKTETQIECTLGGGVSGSYNVKVQTIKGSSGESITFKYESTITAIDRNTGSTAGGSLITITGTNFSTVLLDQQVGIGDFRESYFCEIQSATTTQIVCKTLPIIAESIWLATPAPLFIKLKLSEDSECKTTCQFTFTQTHDFAITAINKTEFVFDENIILTYDKALSDTDTFSLTLKNTLGQETSSNATSISGNQVTFKMPSIKTGTYTFAVNSLANGNSRFQISNTLRSLLKITSISPSSSHRGGAEVTINGNGFYEGQEFFIRIDAEKCVKTVFVNPNEVKCITAQFSAQYTNVPVYTKHENVVTNCDSCSFSTRAEQTTNTAISLTETTDQSSVQTDVTFGVQAVTSEVTSVGLLNLSTKKELSGSFTLNGSTVNLTYTNVPVGEYRILIKTSNGFFRVTQTLVINQDPASISIPVISSSYMGGAEGTFNLGILSEEPTVTVCGFEGKVTKNQSNTYTYETPAFQHQQTVDRFSFPLAAKITPTAIIVKNITYKERLIDGDFSTNIGYTQDCNFVYDFGEGFQVYLSLVKIAPYLNTNITMDDAVLEGSNDNTTFVNLHTFNAELHEGWNEKNFSGAHLYRYIRFSALKCQVSQFEVYGVKVISQTVDLDTHFCDLTIKSGNLIVTENSKVEYRLDKTPEITSISPRYIESTTGGELTVSGSITQECTLTLDGATSTAEIRGGITDVVYFTVAARTSIIEHSLEIKCAGGKAALKGEDAVFVDSWSLNSTWGNDFLPSEGETVFIPKGQTLLVDISPPKLKLVLVEGTLLFNDQDINFDAHYIIVREGKLRAGYEDEPFQNKLTITLHGEKYDRTLPGMGNKVLGAIDGELYLIGQSRTPTWTSLEASASKDATQITLTDEVNWKVGDKIIISITGLNKDEFEERIISEIDSTKKIISFTTPLKYNHFGGSLTKNGSTHQMRAKVAVFSRQIIVQGDESSNSSKHGSHVMLRGKSGKVKGQFKQIEVKNCGQLFNMGRYPLHFHMVGNVNGSYIDGVSVFNSFNRGTTVHGVHYLQIKNSVYYEHFGHGIFIEDSVESFNVIENNLVMKTKKATSLLESDMKAAAMWITRPNNFIRNNVAIGAQFFGFWYDLPGKPTGPSGNVKNVCPVGDQLGAFENNEAHGNGIGLRIYPQYLPRTYQCMQFLNSRKLNPFEDNPLSRQVFKNSLMWNNSQGFFNRRGGTFTLDGFTFISNNNAVTFMQPEFQIKEAMTQIINSTIIGTSPAGTFHSIKTRTVFSLGKKEGVVLKNISIMDFTDGVFADVCSSCDPLNAEMISKGGHVTHFEAFTFTDAVFDTKFSFTHPQYGMDLIYDDGSVLGNAGGSIITPYLKHLDFGDCETISAGDVCSHDCLVCPATLKLRRLEVLNIQNNLKGLNMKVFDVAQGGFANNLVEDTNFSVISYRKESSNQWAGWFFPVILGREYNLHFQNGVELNQIQIQNNYFWDSDERVLLNFNITSTPELFDVSLTGFDNDLLVEKTILVDTPALTQGGRFATYSYTKKTEADTHGNLKIGVSGSQIAKIDVSKIFCRLTCDVESEEEVTEDNIRYFGDVKNWPNEVLPATGADVVIESSWNMLYDLEDSPVYNSLTIKGKLQVSGTYDSAVLRVKRVLIKSGGEFLIGDDQNVFTKKFQLVLYGNKDDEQTILSPFVEPTNKSLINTGLFKVNASSPVTQFAKLAQNAKINETTLNLAETPDWQVDDEIAISSTSQNDQQYEKVKITAISGNVVTITPALSNNHYGAGTMITSQGTLDMRAEVIHLTRNVQVIGDEEGNWGCTIQTVGYRDSFTGNYIQGQSVIKGLEVKLCGQRNYEHGAVSFQGLIQDGKTNSFENSVIRDSLGISMTGKNSINLNVLNTNFFDALQTGIKFEEVTKGSFSGNVLIGVKPRDDYTNLQILDLLNGFEYHSEKFLEENEFVIQNNIISSAPWFAWVVPGHSCTETSSNFTNNVGHSSMAGWFGNRVNTDCQRYSNFIGYKNSEQGLVNRFMIHKLKVENCLFADNGNSIALNGGATGSVDFPYSEVKNTVIIGQAQENCDFCYNNPQDCRTNGIISSLFEIENFEMEFNQYRLPLHNVTFTNFLWGGQQSLDSVQFQNFNYNNEFCKDSDIYVIRTNQFTQDTSVYFKLTGVTLNNVGEANKFFFYNHTRVTHPSFCQKRDCTGIYNILIDDINGGFSNAQIPEQYFGYNKGLNDGNCTFVSDWNGHRCNNVYQLLSIKKTDNERGPIISPIYTSISKFAYEGDQFSPYLNTIDNESLFPNIVKIGAHHKIVFSQSQKNNNHYTLDSNDPKHWAVFSIQNEDPAILVPIVNGKMKKAIRIDNKVEIEWSDYADDCGANVFEEATKTLTFLMNGRSDCQIIIRMKNSLYVSMVFEMDIATYYANGGNHKFIDKISDTLGIHPSTISIVGVRSGSTHIDFRIIPGAESPNDQDLSKAQQQEIINQLVEVNKTLTDKKEEIEIVFDSPLKSYSSSLSIGYVEGFVKYCRFYNFDEALFVASIQEDVLLVDDGRKYIDYACLNCKKKDDCFAQLYNVCLLHSSFLGKKCDSVPETKIPVDDQRNGGNDPQSKGNQLIRTLTLMLLLILK